MICSRILLIPKSQALIPSHINRKIIRTRSCEISIVHSNSHTIILWQSCNFDSFSQFSFLFTLAHSQSLSIFLSLPLSFVCPIHCLNVHTLTSGYKVQHTTWTQNGMLNFARLCTGRGTQIICLYMSVYTHKQKQCNRIEKASLHIIFDAIITFYVFCSAKVKL